MPWIRLTTSNHFYHYIPLHFVAYLKTKRCIHPVMAFHQAYIMAAQCDHPPPGDPADFALRFSHTCFQVSFNLCLDLPDCIDIVYLSETIGRPLSGKTVSCSVNLCIFERGWDWHCCLLYHAWERSAWMDWQTLGTSSSSSTATSSWVSYHTSETPSQPWHCETATTDHTFRTFDQFGDTHPETQEQTMNISSWYIPGQDHRECRRPRSVRLGGNFLERTDTIQNAWRGGCQLSRRLTRATDSCPGTPASWKSCSILCSVPRTSKRSHPGDSQIQFVTSRSCRQPGKCGSPWSGLAPPSTRIRWFYQMVHRL